MVVLDVVLVVLDVVVVSGTVVVVVTDDDGVVGRVVVLVLDVELDVDVELDDVVVVLVVDESSTTLATATPPPAPASSSTKAIAHTAAGLIGPAPGRSCGRHRHEGPELTLDVGPARLVEDLGRARRRGGVEPRGATSRRRRSR